MSDIHDAFGAPVATDPPPHDPPLTEPQPSSPSPTRAWVAGGVAAVVLGVGGFFGVGLLADHTKSTGLASGGGGFPGGGPGGGGLPGGGPGGRGPGGGVTGTVASVNGSTFTVTTGGATETVKTTPATRFSKTVTASLSDVEVGDRVRVLGNGVATSVIDGAPTFAPGPATGPGGGFGGPPPGQLPGQGPNAGPPFAQGGAVQGPGQPDPGDAVQGTVTSNANGRLVVSEPGGATATFTTSSSTVVSKVTTSSLSALTVGEGVVVMGTTSNGSLTATSVTAGAR